MKALAHRDPPRITKRLLLNILSAWLLIGLIEDSSTFLDTTTSLAAANWNQPFTAPTGNKTTSDTYLCKASNDLVRLVAISKANEALYSASVSWKKFGYRQIETLPPINVTDNLDPVAQAKNSFIAENNTTQKEIFTQSPHAMVQLIAARRSENTGPGPPTRADVKYTS